MYYKYLQNLLYYLYIYIYISRTQKTYINILSEQDLTVLKMEGEIICRENVKPCSPTPPCNRIYKPSLLDQIFPPITVPLVLYYPNNINNNNPISNNINNIDEYISQTTQNLKQSLSATLSLFYPLAGRVKDSFSTDCNDQGALFIVARFDCNLSAFLGKPDLIRASLSHLPSRLMWVEPTPGSHVAMIQVINFHYLVYIWAESPVVF